MEARGRNLVFIKPSLLDSSSYTLSEYIQTVFEEVQYVYLRQTERLHFLDLADILAFLTHFGSRSANKILQKYCVFSCRQNILYKNKGKEKHGLYVRYL